MYVTIYKTNQNWFTDYSTLDYSYPGLFVPLINYSHNINCWCEVPPGCVVNASRPKWKTS